MLGERSQLVSGGGDGDGIITIIILIPEIGDDKAACCIRWLAGCKTISWPLQLVVHFQRQVSKGRTMVSCLAALGVRGLMH